MFTLFLLPPHAILPLFPLFSSHCCPPLHIHISSIISFPPSFTHILLSPLHYISIIFLFCHIMLYFPSSHLHMFLFGFSAFSYSCHQTQRHWHYHTHHIHMLLFSPLSYMATIAFLPFLFYFPQLILFFFSLCLSCLSSRNLITHILLVAVMLSIFVSHWLVGYFPSCFVFLCPLFSPHYCFTLVCYTSSGCIICLHIIVCLVAGIILHSHTHHITLFSLWLFNNNYYAFHCRMKNIVGR